MFEELRTALDDLSIPIDGPALAEVFALRDRLDAKISEAVGAFDAAQLWELDGATSMTAWLRDRCRLIRRDAARTASTARRLRPFAATGQAWTGGVLSAGQIVVILGALDETTAATYADQQAELIAAVASLSVSDTATAMAHWKAHAEAVAGGDPPPPPAPSALHLSATLDGRYVLDADLDALGGSLLASALRLAQSRDVAGEPARTPGQRRADALLDICRFYLDHQQHRRGGRHRPHLNVVIDLLDLPAGRTGQVLDGAHLDPITLSTLLCDCALHRVLTVGRSTILDYGTSTRTIPAPLWNALVIRDEHCRMPGCDRPGHWCEGHHVIWYENGGPTRLINLVLLCSRHHHHLLHRPGWHAQLKPDATLEITHPDGRISTSAPPGTLRSVA